MSPWLFSTIFMNGCMGEIKAKVVALGTRLVMMAESERMLQKSVDEFHRVSM